MTHATTSLKLPPLVMTPTDITRLLREIGMLDEYLRQQALRTPGQPTAKLPKTSRLLDELTETNGMNLLDAQIRGQLATLLKDLSLHAPVVQVSFAVDPSSAFLQKIVLWFRENAGQPVLIRVGLQPAIAAGCAVRTPNKSFDFSLRQHLLRQRHYLRDALATTGAVKSSVPASAEPVAEAIPTSEVSA
jgi:hypothetical protein